MTLIPTPTGMDAWMASVSGSPPPSGTSPDDTTATLITAPSTTTRTDAGGHSWVFSTASSGTDWKVLKDGVWAYGSAAGSKMGIKSGIIYVYYSAGNQWYKDTGTSFVLSASPF